MSSTNTQKKVVGLRFGINETVVCPAHGLGQIVNIEKYNVANQELEVCKIFFEKDQMNLMIPINKMVEMRVRRLVSKDTVNKVFSILSRPSKSARGMWNKRAKEYDSKLYSGSILLTAEVVRDLWSGVNDMNRSYSERIIFENAFNRVTGEVAIVMNVAKEEAENLIVTSLDKSRNSKSSGMIIEDDSFTVGEDDMRHAA